VGWIVQVLTGDSNQPDAILAKNLINASGLSANLVLNSLARTEDERIPLYFARGSYASYRGPGVGDVNKLLYPVPPSGPKSKDAHGFQGLGTHLTLDLGGNIKFGPDVEWIEPPKGVDEKDEETIDFWQAHHRPTESEEKLAAIHESVTEYLPGIKKEGLSIDYAGIRPKIGGPTAGFQDFQFRFDRSDGNGNTGAPMVTLLGIESPGLTSALAIAEHVDDLLARSATTQAMLN
jgi:L-2-hydroxyglutarate oxidase LhgO